jgi:predicted AlkP superfamily pyrophosphatase or phosphodiesterase
LTEPSQRMGPLRPQARACVTRLGAVLLLCACGGEAGDVDRAAAPRPKVALIGVDGATWRVIDPLLQAGKLPHLAGLIQRGARAVLRKPSQDDASPVLWASIMTGTSPTTHGIQSFARRDENGKLAVVASTDRKVPALWNMVHARGGTSGVLGIWNTWPAEEIDGYIVSDRFAHTLYRHNYQQRGVDAHWGITWPEQLTSELQRFALAPDSLQREDIERLGRFSDAEWREMIHGDDHEGPTTRNGLVALKFGWQAQESVAAASLHMLGSRPQPDLFVTFLELPDRSGHYFWQAYEPEAVSGGFTTVEAEWRERWSEVVPRSYEVVDEWIGRLLEALDPETTVIVVSDHGMQSTGQPGGRLADLGVIYHSGKHHDEGILIAAGPAIAQISGHEARNLQVAPLVLAALGLPASTQFEAPLPTSLLARDFLKRHPLAPPISEPDRRKRTEQEAPEGLDAEYIKQLEAIGYLDSQGRERTTTSADDDGH